jgi:hypothetical protein
VVNRVWTGSYAGLQGHQGRCEITHIRYDFPKNWHSMIRMSKWISLGVYKQDQPNFQPPHHALCARSAMEAYYRRTVSLPIKRTVEPDRPQEHKTRFFISLIKADQGRYIAVKSVTIAKRIKNLLFNGGVDVDSFQSHSLRHVSINAQIAMGQNVDDVLARACVSSKVFAMYYQLPFKSSAAPSAAEKCMFEDPDRENRPPNVSILREQVRSVTTASSTVTTANRLRITSAAQTSRRQRRTASAVT